MIKFGNVYKYVYVYMNMYAVGFCLYHYCNCLHYYFSEHNISINLFKLKFNLLFLLYK